jgi:Ala-tRNA(Pro) deacylase
MPTARLKDYLDREQVKYQSLPHATTFTAQETAQAAHVPGKQVAKAVVIKINGELALAVLPATDQIHLDQLQQALGTGQVELAKEYEFEARFADCDAGAMPPFGNLYGMEVYVSQRLREDEAIAFNAGTHDELIEMRYRDFERLASPTVLRF